MSQLDKRDDASVICAHLLRQGYIKKSDYPRLEIDELLFKGVKDRLAQVGMELVINVYSPFYAVRLSQDSQETIEESNNLSLKSNELAMLVILWSKLVFPKRVEAVPTSLPQENATDQEEKNEAETPKEEKKKEKKKAKKKARSTDKDRIFVELGELYAEFGKHFGSRTTFKSILSRLHNLKFIHMHNEVITEGLFLDLLIDGYQMGNEIKRSALAYKLAGLTEEEVDDWEEEEEMDDFDDEPLFDLADENNITGIEVAFGGSEEEKKEKE